jgi:glycosyltransferase involved in cell wall biosynthesis
LVTVDEGYWADGLDWFQRKIHQQELNGCVVNLGQVPQDEIWKEYKDADIIFFPSRCESFGFPLVESLASGKPILASDISVNKEICGDAASFFRNGSAEDAAAKLMLMLEVEERNKYSKLASAWFVERDWSWRAYAARFDKMMSGLS